MLWDNCLGVCSDIYRLYFLFLGCSRCERFGPDAFCINDWLCSVLRMIVEIVGNGTGLLLCRLTVPFLSIRRLGLLWRSWVLTKLWVSMEVASDDCRLLSIRVMGSWGRLCSGHIGRSCIRCLMHLDHRI